MTKETKKSESKTYGGIYSLFFSPPATPQEQIFQELKAEIKNLAEISNRLGEVYSYFDKGATRIVSSGGYSFATPEAKVQFRLNDSFAGVFRHANIGLHDLTSDLRDIFLSELSFDDKCTAAMAVAEAAKKILSSIVALPLETHPLGTFLVGESILLLDATISNINSLGAQGQALSVKSRPVKPFTGPSFSI